MIASNFVVRDDEHGYDYAYFGIDPTSDEADEIFGRLLRQDDLAPSDVVCGTVVRHSHETGMIDQLFPGDIIYVPEAGRAAMMRGEFDWEWTDADDTQDALERFMRVGGKGVLE